MMSTTRLVFDTELVSGTQTPACYSMPRLLELLNEQPLKQRPTLVRGDSAFGNEKVVAPLEAMNVDYLFKVKQTKGGESTC